MNLTQIIEGVEKEFEKKFGNFYLKPFPKTGKFLAFHGTSENAAEIDIELGKGKITASGDIKSFISAKVTEAYNAGYDEAVKIGAN